MNLHRKIFFICMLLAPLQINAQNKPEIAAQNNDEHFMAPSWSPDGSKIAFTTGRYEGIKILDIESGNITTLTEEPAAGFGFRWSGSGKNLLARVAKYEGIKRLSAVKLFNTETKSAELLTDYRAAITSAPIFAMSDSKVFLYSKNKAELFSTGIKPAAYKNSAGSSKIFYIKDDKIAAEDINKGSTDIIEPVKGEKVLNLQPSPNSGKLVFEIVGGDMYSMNSDGTGLTDLGKGYRPKWAPDNEHITYMITEDNGETITSSDIYTIKFDGTEKTNITGTQDKTEMNPDWSPDGTRIAFDTIEDGAIWILKLSK